jgi:hypothetical protein
MFFITFLLIITLILVIYTWLMCFYIIMQETKIVTINNKKYLDY